MRARVSNPDRTAPVTVARDAAPRPTSRRRALLRAAALVVVGLPAVVLLCVLLDALLTVLVAGVLGVALPADLDGSDLPLAAYGHYFICLALLVLGVRIGRRAIRGELYRDSRRPGSSQRSASRFPSSWSRRSTSAARVRYESGDSSPRRARD